MKALKFEILIKLNIAGGVKKILCENKTMLEKMVQSLVNNSLLKNMFVPPSYLKKKNYLKVLHSNISFGLPCSFLNP